MNPSRPLKKILTILAALAAAAAVVFAIVLLGIDSGEEQTPTAGLSKIKRPKMAANADYKAYLQEGDERRYLADWQGAIEAYQQASALEPKEYAPYEKIGDVFFLQKNYASAVKNFDFAVQLAPQSAGLPVKSVRSLLGLRKTLDAKTRLENIQPPSQASVFYEGLIAAFLNDLGRAKERLAQSLTMGADESLKQNAQKILANMRDFELARDGRIEFLQVMLAQSFDQIGEPGLAIEMAFDALKTQHDYRDAWIVLGHSFLLEEKWMDAKDALDKAIQLDAGHPAGFFFRGVAQQKLEEPAEALADFQAATGLGFKPQIQAKQNLADLFFNLNDFEKAYPLYKEIVAADPSDMSRFVRPMALAINHLGKPAEALELARKAYEQHPDTALGHNLLGWAAFANNDLVAARQHLSQALTRDPKLAAAHLNLAMLLEKEGSVADAREEYLKAIELSEKSGDDAIGNTARLRYNTVGQEAQSNEPQRQTFTPSLSLE